MKLPTLLTEEEVAKEARVSVVSVLVAADAGSLMPIGKTTKGRPMFDSKAVEAWVLKRAGVDRQRQQNEPRLAQRGML